MSHRYLCSLLFFLPLAMAADHFDIASVKPAERPTRIRGHSPGRIRYEGIGYIELIEKAFALPGQFDQYDLTFAAGPKLAKAKLNRTIRHQAFRMTMRILQR